MILHIDQQEKGSTLQSGIKTKLEIKYFLAWPGHNVYLLFPFWRMGSFAGGPASATGLTLAV